MDINAIEKIVEGANTRVGWSMTLIGVSLLTILSTSYVRPVHRWAKLMYLLFIPGWVYLAMVIHAGDKIVRRGIMAALYPDRIPSIERKINDEFMSQLQNFNNGLIFFGAWLLCYLFYWIFSDFSSKAKP